MDFPLHYLIFAAALVVVIMGVALAFRRGKPQAGPGETYITALKQLIDGDADGAFQNLQAAVKHGLAPADAYIKLGNLLKDRGEVSKALQIHQSLTVKPDLTKSEKVQLFMTLADDYAKMGNSEKASQVLESAIRNLQIRDPEVLVTLAKHQHLMGSKEKAYETLKEARKHGGIGDRELALYLASTAGALVERGELKEARKILQRALKHNPDCASCLLVLGDIAERAEQLDEAIGHWKRVAVLSPQLADTVLNKLETTLYDKGRFGDIENVYNDVRAARLGDEAASLSLAAFYVKQGRGEDAIEMVEEYLTVYPDSVRASLLLTSLYAKLRDTETLERFLDKSIKHSGQAEKFRCGSCQLQSSSMRWHCPRCNAFDSFSSNHEI